MTSGTGVLVLSLQLPVSFLSSSVVFKWQGPAAIVTARREPTGYAKASASDGSFSGWISEILDSNSCAIRLQRWLSSHARRLRSNKKARLIIGAPPSAQPCMETSNL